MSDEILDRMDRFAADGELDMDGLAGRARWRGRRRVAFASLGTVAAVGLGAIGLAQLPSAPSVEVGPLADGEDAVGGGGAAGDGPGGGAVGRDVLLSCGGIEYTTTQLDAAPLAVTVGLDAPVDAVEIPVIDAEGDIVGDFTSADDWRLLSMDEQNMRLLRPLTSEDDPNMIGGEAGATHQAFTAFTFEQEDGTTGWHYGSLGGCVQRVVATGSDGPLGEADVQLASRPAAEDTSIELLVTERACASGQDAQGRVQLVDLELTATEVRVVIGVRPLEGGGCPTHPATPFTLELGEPLGERILVDASVVPSRPLSVGIAPGAAPEMGADIDELLERALSVELPDVYSYELEMLCFDCPGPQIYRVTFDDGAVTRDTPQDPGAMIDPALAPTLTELLVVIRAAWEAGLVDGVQLDEAGLIRSVSFSATPDGIPDGVIGWAIYELQIG